MRVRKIVTIVEEICAEGGREVSPAARVAVVAAVIENPWAGEGFVEDLRPGIEANASALGALLAPQVLEALGAPAEAYGKAGIVGLDGEVEHVTDATIRSHHQTVEVRLADAPHPGELVIALAAAAQGRPQQRLAALSTEQ
jgi:hypothetical protein